MTFNGDAGFDGATFNGNAGFEGATFTGEAGFGRATFGDNASFNSVAFGDHASFRKANFGRKAEFPYANFTGDADFKQATFGDTQFYNVTFTGDADFNGAAIDDFAWFADARFEQTRQLGPLIVGEGVVLDNAQFAQPVRIEVSSMWISCRRAQFPSGVQFWLRWAKVVLDDADLAAPSILAGISQLSSKVLVEREEQIAGAWRLQASDLSERPQLMSLQRANVGGLGLSNISAARSAPRGIVVDRNMIKVGLEHGAWSGPWWLRLEASWPVNYFYSDVAQERDTSLESRVRGERAVDEGQHHDRDVTADSFREDLWVPRTSSTLCDQAILVDQSIGAICEMKLGPGRRHE